MDHLEVRAPASGLSRKNIVLVTKILKIVFKKKKPNKKEMPPSARQNQRSLQDGLGRGSFVRWYCG